MFKFEIFPKKFHEFSYFQLMMKYLMESNGKPDTIEAIQEAEEDVDEDEAVIVNFHINLKKKME